MHDVTAVLERAATCIRDLWNTYFYVRDDSELLSYPADKQELFEDIEGRLVGALVLFDLDRLAAMEKFRQEPLPFLVLVPAHEGVELLVKRPSTDGHGYWDDFDGQVGPGDVTLHFVEWFDWDYYGQRQLEYYRTKIHAFGQRPEFVGREALIGRRNARVSFDPTR